MLLWLIVMTSSITLYPFYIAVKLVFIILAGLTFRGEIALRYIKDLSPVVYFRAVFVSYEVKYLLDVLTKLGYELTPLINYSRTYYLRPSGLHDFKYIFMGKNALPNMAIMIHHMLSDNHVLKQEILNTRSTFWRNLRASCLAVKRVDIDLDNCQRIFNNELAKR